MPPHVTICTLLSAVQFPVELWSDFSSPLQFAADCANFSQRVRSMYSSPVGCTAAGDMRDCFRHIPAREVNSYWLELRSFWVARGISCVSVRRRRDGEPGRLGLYDHRGYIVVTCDAITTALLHFIRTNFCACWRLGRQGMPWRTDG